MATTGSTSRVAQLVDVLRFELLSGKTPLGIKLPAQREMAQRYGVSRATVREAIIELQNKGLVETYHGGGSFFANPLAAQFQLPLSNEQQSDLQIQVQVMEMREVLEGEAAYYAALRASDEQLAALGDEYQRMLRRSAGDTTLSKAKADLTFHMLIASSSHHFLVMALSDILYTRYFNAIYGVLDRTLQKTGRYPQGIPAQHAQIYEALKARDADKARESASRHIAFTRQQLTAVAGSGGHERMK